MCSASDKYSYSFGQVISFLREGKACQRAGWKKTGTFVVKQIPCSIEGLIIDKMQSLPQSAKDILKSRDGVPKIQYASQLLVINGYGVADSYAPSADDVFAMDWGIVEV